MDIKNILSTIFILFLKIITLFGIIVVLLCVLVLIIFIIFPCLRWSDYKVAIQDAWMFDDVHNVDIKKGDLCRFSSLGSGTHMSATECKSGAKGNISDWQIEKYFADI